MINIQKSTAFPYTNRELSERESKKKKKKKLTYIYNLIKKNKILRNNLNQEVKDLYFENYKHQWRK